MIHTIPIVIALYLKTLKVTRLRSSLQTRILTVLYCKKTLSTMRQKCVIVRRVFKCARKKEILIMSVL